MAGLETINHVNMRNRNIAVIFNYLYRYAPISRADLSKMTGLNKATVTGIIRKITEYGFLLEKRDGRYRGHVGHPSTELIINPDAGRIIGVEINPETITTAVLDLSPRIVWRTTEPFPRNAGSDYVIELIIRLILDAYSRLKTDPIPILGIVIGLPGMVDIKNNVLINSPDLGWRNISIGDPIQKAISLPVAIGNSTHMGSVAENYFGVSKDSLVSVYLNLGTSITSGIVILDNVLSSPKGSAGEVGHMIVDPEGEICSCGNKGCWNTRASLQALQKNVHWQIRSGVPTLIQNPDQDDYKKFSLDEVIRAAIKGDKVACSAFDQTGFWLGTGISNLIKMVNPETIVLGGPMSAAARFLLPGIQKEIEKRAFIAEINNAQIKVARFREDSCLIGSLAVYYWNLMNEYVYISLPERQIFDSNNIAEAAI